jgi:DNA adenine methylase
MIALLKAKLNSKYKHNPLAQPFLKWAGGKRQLLSIICNYIPKSYNHYYEPFIGAGAVFLSLQSKKATINDLNSELINCYQVIKTDPEELFLLCQEHKRRNSKEYFYSLRDLDRTENFKELPPIERAARIIYLNKTCFNGLFRVNSHGQFNVPYGDYINPTIIDHTVLVAVSTYLNQNNVTILEGDYVHSVASATKKSFIYFDPPYHPLSATSSFTGYAMDGFGEAQQIKLKLLCDELDAKGCQILLSNSNAPLIRELYEDPRYEIVEVQATRAINSVGAKRGKISELLIYNRYERKVSIQQTANLCEQI